MRFGIGMTAAGLALAGVAAVALAQGNARPAPPRDDRVKAMFAQVDADKDGYVTRAEADTARAALRTRMETSARERRDRAFARLDGNKDGQVSRAEFDAAPRMAMMPAARGDRMGPRGRRGDRDGMMAGAFERLDADRDGRVSLAEAEAVAGRRWAMRDGRRDGDRRGMRGHRALPPGHPPVPGAPAPMSDAERPLGGGRD